jgi:N-methylhydantoinase A
MVATHLETNERQSFKTLTTHKDPSEGVESVFKDFLSQTGVSGEEVDMVIHATTLVTNTLIERKGAKTALVTTKGFKDVIEIGREWRFDMYDLDIEPPIPLVERQNRFEVQERVNAKGQVVTSLNPEDMDGVVRKIKHQGIESVAVCFLHSFLEGRHEREVKDYLEKQVPDLSVSLSCECLPEIREYERMSTTAINAYTQPTTEKYLRKLAQKLSSKGYERDDFFVMLSNGGITSSTIAQRYPCRFVESGPAAGAIGSAHVGRLIGKNNILSFDMGGTTAKLCVIEEGVPHLTTDFEVDRVYRFRKGSGLPLRLPVIDMIEIGAGGGSIARVNDMNLLKVGPSSAGSEPGPICYDHGGEEPTVTDADLVLGYLNPDFFLGGRMKLNMEKSRRIMREELADPLGLDLTRAAWGVRQVIDENMASAARVYAAEKGIGYDDYTMIGFGGQGPVHSFTLGRLLRVKEIIIPFQAGVGSALGLLVSPVKFDLVRSYLGKLIDLDMDYLNDIFRRMEEEALELVNSAGVSPSEATITRSADMRYYGQGHEINAPIPGGVLTEGSLDDIRRNFSAEYMRKHHRLNKELEIEGISWRVEVTGPPKISGDPQGSVREQQTGTAWKGKRKAYSPEHGCYVDFDIYDREKLGQGEKIKGPAIIEENESTTVVGCNDSLEVGFAGALVLNLGYERG